MFPSKRSYATGVGSQPPSSSAAEISDNQDLITEILLRLPIKSLIRFKSVSKQWLSLISDPRFCLLHGSGSPRQTSGLLLDRRQSTFGFINLDLSSSGSAEPPFKTLDFRVVQSCNGLLLCSTGKNVKRRECVVYNPTTSRFSSKLPPISGDISGIALAFEPSRSPHYKVICVMASQFRISVYSSETDRWKIIDRAFGLESSEMAFENGVYWNGSLHWIGVWDMGMSFDVDDETMALFPMPPLPGEFIDYAFMRRYFGESRGHLHLVDQLDVLHSPRLHIHEMESDYSRWTLTFRVSLSHIPGSFPQIVQPDPRGFAFSVLCVIRGGPGNDLGSYLVLQIPGKVLRYNLETGTFFKLRDLVSGSRDHPLALLKWTEVHQFVECLAPVV